MDKARTKTPWLRSGLTCPTLAEADEIAEPDDLRDLHKDHKCGGIGEECPYCEADLGAAELHGDLDRDWEGDQECRDWDAGAGKRWGGKDYP